MREITKLSNDLTTITAEINSYKQVAGNAVVEIGKRLNHVKENDLAHGEFGSWLAEIGIERTSATKFMKVASELNDSNYATSHNLGANALYLISTMPEEERQKEHIIPSTGESKTPDDMTVRELREVKKSLKQAEEEAEQARRSEQIALRQLEEAENKEPEVIERTIEVDNPETKKSLIEKERQLQTMKASYQEQAARLAELEKESPLDDSYEETQREHEKLSLQADNGTLELLIYIDEFLEKAAVTAFRQGAIAQANDRTKKRLNESVSSLESFAREVKTAISGRIKI